MGRSATSFGAAILYVFGDRGSLQRAGSAAHVFERALVSGIRATPPSAGDLSPLQDQQLGGVIMWVPSGFVFIVIALALLAKWIAESDRRLKFGMLAAVLEKEEPS